MINVLGIPEARNLIFGVFIKTLGYLIIASGIFLAIGKPEIAIKVVYLGTTFVAIGWVVIIRSLLSVKKIEGEKAEKFKVSLSAKGGMFGLRNSVELKGEIREIVGKSFEKTRGKVKLYLDEKLIDELFVDGSFRIKLENLEVGKHSAEVRFVEGKVNKKINFEVVDSRTWLKSFSAFVFLFLFIFSLLVFCVFLAFNLR